MLQIKELTITHRKDLRVIIEDFNLVLNDGDKAVIIGEEGNGKSTLMKWIYNPKLVADYIEANGVRILGQERFGYLPQELPKQEREKRWKYIVLYISHDETLIENTANMVIHIEQIQRKTKARYTVAKLSYRRYVEERLHSFERQEQQALNDRRENPG